MDQVTEPAEPARLVVCVRNDGYELDLVPRKVYQVHPDASAERSGCIRIVDETGEDYPYPEGYFRPLDAFPTRVVERPARPRPPRVEARG